MNYRLPINIDARREGVCHCMALIAVTALWASSQQASAAIPIRTGA